MKSLSGSANWIGVSIRIEQAYDFSLGRICHQYGTTDFNTSSKKFENWKKKTKVVLKDDKSKAWYQDHKDSVEEKRAEYWDKWIQKSTEDLAARTLNANDGVE